MPKQPYLTAPIKTDKMPPGIPFIVGNEAAERFTFYGLKGVLVIFMTKYLLNSSGVLDPMTPEEAKARLEVLKTFKVLPSSARAATRHSL